MKYNKIIEDLKNGGEVKLGKFLTCKIVSNKYHIHKNGKLRKSIYKMQDLTEYFDLLHI